MYLKAKFSNQLAFIKTLLVGLLRCFGGVENLMLKEILRLVPNSAFYTVDSEMFART